MGRNRIKCSLLLLFCTLLLFFCLAQFIVVGSNCVAGCNFSIYRVES